MSKRSLSTVRFCSLDPDFLRDHQTLIEQSLLKEEDFNLFEVEEPDKKHDAPDEERFA